MARYRLQHRGLLGPWKIDYFALHVLSLQRGWAVQWWNSEHLLTWHLQLDLALLELCHQTPGKKEIELGLFPVKEFFLMYFFIEAQQKQTASNSLSYYPGEVIFSHKRGKKKNQNHK